MATRSRTFDVEPPLLDGDKVQPHSNLIASRTHICEKKGQDTVYAIDTLRLERGRRLFCAPPPPPQRQGEGDEQVCI
jgi:hypothetical protein